MFGCIQTTYFKKLQRRSTKTGICTVCGKKCSLSKTFYQTINPFNKNSDGQVKTSREISDELDNEVKAWKEKPATHVKCQSKAASC